MEILIKEHDAKGSATAIDDGQTAGKMTYSKAGSHVIIIDHTEVSPAYSGQGVGKQMLYKLVEMARFKELKIIPLCPYAASVFKKEEGIRDVLKA